jgi:hypothetical protein
MVSRPHGWLDDAKFPAAGNLAANFCHFARAWPALASAGVNLFSESSAAPPNSLRGERREDFLTGRKFSPRRAGNSFVMAGELGIFAAPENISRSAGERTRF